MAGPRFSVATVEGGGGWRLLGLCLAVSCSAPVELFLYIKNGTGNASESISLFHNGHWAAGSSPPYQFSIPVLLQYRTGTD